MRKIGCLAFILLLLSGCTGLDQPKPSVPPEQAWQQRQQKLTGLTAWELSGRSSITQGKQGGTVSVRWIQKADNFHITLTGPFYQGGADLKGNANSSTMIMDDGKVIHAASPELLIAKTMGLYLPVSALRDWVRGLPYAKLPVGHYQLNDYGRLTLLEQAGWEIRYLRYVHLDPYSLPSKIFITNKKNAVNIKLIVSDWSYPE